MPRHVRAHVIAPRTPAFAVALAILWCALAATPRVAAAGTPPPRLSFAGCPQVILYGARDSGEPLDGDQLGLGSAGHGLYATLSDALGAGVIGAGANGYPAVPADVLLPADQVFTAAFTGSIAQGAAAADADLRALARLCPASLTVVTGTSQGAEVLRAAMRTLSTKAKDLVAAIVLYGDPYFAAGETRVAAYGTFAPERSGLHRAYSGAPPRVARRWAGLVASWCHAEDRMCQSVEGGSGRDYATDAGAAANVVLALLARRGVTPPRLPIEPRS